MTSLYNVNYLQHLCQKYGLIPSKKYGQNFLINEEPIAVMLEAGEIKKDDEFILMATKSEGKVLETGYFSPKYSRLLFQGSLEFCPAKKAPQITLIFSVFRKKALLPSRFQFLSHCCFPESAFQ